MTATIAAPANQQTPPPSASRTRVYIGGIARTAAGFGIVIVAWEVIARLVLGGTNLIAPPTGIVSSWIDNWDLYQRAMSATLWSAARGFFWGNLAAVTLAGFVVLAPATERVVLRLSLVIFCLPLVAMGPILRVVWGTGDGPQVTLAALAVFYTTLVPLLVGFRAVPQSWTDLVHSYGRGRFRVLTTVRIRASVPYLFAGLQVAAPAAFLGALVGEFTGAQRGMGLLTINSMRALRTNDLWAVATISALVSMAAYVIVGMVGRRLAIGQPALLMTPPSGGPAITTRRRVIRALTEAAISVSIVLVLWIGLMAVLDLDNYFAKRPADVWDYLFGRPASQANRTEILDALSGTARIAIPGYIVGLVLGAVFAALFDLYDTVRRTLTPFAVALRCVPIVVIAPLLVQAFGRGMTGTTTTVAIMTFFPTLVACSHGLRQTPGQVLEFYSVYDTGRVRTLLSGQVPAMVPAFFAAARIAVPTTVLAATVAEWLATGTGMGNLMALTAVNSRYETLWACIFVVTVIVAAAYGVVAIVEQWVLARVAPEQLSW